ncbi:hypothetical protein Barb7_03099 [Bacteroidales bacterium Barb7]|nr:hypothetical protein Barb7_03154 [Bacteroidales bacterium Barb7]OAV72472.1 hypothetical protein Barb7_03099 [Bacteroidales bacterium Barb7]
MTSSESAFVLKSQKMPSDKPEMVVAISPVIRMAI